MWFPKERIYGVLVILGDFEHHVVHICEYTYRTTHKCVPCKTCVYDMLTYQSHTNGTCEGDFGDVSMIHLRKTNVISKRAYLWCFGDLVI